MKYDNGISWNMKIVSSQYKKMVIIKIVYIRKIWFVCW